MPRVARTKEHLAAKLDELGLGPELEAFAAQLDDGERTLLQELLIERAGGLDFAVQARLEAKGWVRRTLDEAERRGREGGRR